MYKTKYPIIWKRFSDGNNFYSNLIVSYSFDNYYPLICNEIEKLIDLGFDLNNTYILCPVYQDRIGGPSDFEFGVGGTEKSDETSEEAAVRELGEEVGLILKKKGDYMENYYIGSRILKGRKYSGYVIPATNTKFLTSLTKKKLETNLSTAKDKLNKSKIHCLVYGSEKDITEKLEYFKKIHVFENDDNIIGVGYQPLSMVLKYCKIKKLIKSPSRKRSKSPVSWRTGRLMSPIKGSSDNWRTGSRMSPIKGSPDRWRMTGRRMSPRKGSSDNWRTGSRMSPRKGSPDNWRRK